MLGLDIPDPAKELLHFREPLEGWLSPQNCENGHFPLVFIVAPPISPTLVLLGRKKRGFGKGRCVPFGSLPSLFHTSCDMAYLRQNKWFRREVGAERIARPMRRARDQSECCQTCLWLIVSQEECGLVVDEAALEERGRIAIVRHAVTNTVVAHIHLYVVRQWTGEIVE